MNWNLLRLILFFAVDKEHTVSNASTLTLPSLRFFDRERARRDSNPRQPDFFRNDKSPVLYLAELRAHISE